MRELQAILAILILLVGAVLAVQMVAQQRRVLRMGPVQQMEEAGDDIVSRSSASQDDPGSSPGGEIEE